MTLRTPPFRLISVVLAGLVTACGAGNGAERGPEASVAESLQAQRDFREIHRRWANGRPTERGRLEPALVDFIARHPNDRRVRMARVYLAWIYVQRGKLDEARRLVAETRHGPTGSARDFAAVAEAAILLREGKPDQAQSVLTPLDGKLIDPEERFLYGEQRVMAALSAHRDRDAVDYMLNWLVQVAPDDRAATQGRVHDLIAGLGNVPLERSLRGLAGEETAANPDVAEARAWLLDSVGDRLVQIALSKNDGELARRLLDTKIQSLTRGKKGADLARIAAAGSVMPRVSGRAVGFVLASGTTDSRRRSAQVVAGMSRALGLPATAANPEAVQLVTSEDSGEAGSLERALAELAGEGAVILVAGLDADGAARAARYAHEAAIPTMLLFHTKISDGDHAFGLGVDADLEASTLEAALGSSAKLARVGTGGVACDVRSSEAGQPRFPVADWKRDGIEALAVYGDGSCARDTAHEIAQAGRKPILGLGLECAELFDSLDVLDRRVALGAGSFPYRKAENSPADEKKFVEQTGRSPSWYASLGHDAAALARHALSGFAIEHVEDARVVRKLHEDAERRLANAETELWSSEKRGFHGGRTLERQLVTVKAQKGKP